MEEKQILESKQRISWIDTAKGFLLLCVVAGHTLPFFSKYRIIIYTFHIPMFIVLSGYTFSVPQAVAEIFAKSIKLFKALYIPIVLVFAIETVMFHFINNITFIKSIIWFLKKLYYCNCVLWFFTALFWSKLFYSLLCHFKLEHFVLFFPMAVLNVFLEKRFPGMKASFQNIDMIGLFMFCLYCGRFFRRNEKVFDKFKIPLVAVCFLIWRFFYKKAFLDFGLRIFNGAVFLAIVPVCAIVVVTYFCKALDLLKPCRVALSFIGKNTIPILCIHEIEVKLIKWNSYISDDMGILKLVPFILLRLALVGIMFALFFLIRIGVRKFSEVIKK